MPWSEVFLVFAVSILLVLIVLPFLRSTNFATRQELEESLVEVCCRALKDPSYIMIFLGFFSCGFQLAFITAHFPALVEEMCIGIPQDSLLRSIGVSTTSALGAFSIAVIGMATAFAVYLLDRMTRKMIVVHTDGDSFFWGAEHGVPRAAGPSK